MVEFSKEAKNCLAKVAKDVPAIKEALHELTTSGIFDSGPLYNGAYTYESSHLATSIAALEYAKCMEGQTILPFATLPSGTSVNETVSSYVGDPSSSPSWPLYASWPKPPSSLIPSR